MAVRTTSDKKQGSPADRWRAPTLADRARQAQSAAAQPPISSHMAHEPERAASVHTPPEEELVLVRVPRKFLPFINPEYVMSQKSNTANATATAEAPKSADTLRAEIAHHQQQLDAANEQLSKVETAGPVVAAANTNGKRNLGKTVGKVAGAVGVTGVLVLGGYYLMRYLKR